MSTEPSDEPLPDLPGSDQITQASRSNLALSFFSLSPEKQRAMNVFYAFCRVVDDVADLKDAYPARMHLVHVLSREPQEVELYSGRLDASRLRKLLPLTVSVRDVDHWWLCGPFEMVTGAVSVLGELGVSGVSVHRELFWVGDDPPVEAVHLEEAPGDGASLTVVLDGRSSTLTLPPGTTVLDGAQQVRPDLPFACKGGVCGTCRARVTAGSATMRRNYALEKSETDAGYVLTCQAVPSSDEITVDYDA